MFYYYHYYSYCILKNVLEREREGEAWRHIFKIIIKFYSFVFTVKRIYETIEI